MPTPSWLRSLDPDEDAETYWGRAAANLKAGRIRMVFVAGQIPRELRRVVEFLNEQMAAEVIAIEAKQYVGPEGLRTLVPRVVGQTAAAETRKRPREGRRWDEASLLAEMADRQGGEIAAVVGKLIAWATAHEGVRVAYSKGANRAASRAPECMPGRRPCST